jgi:hypothetical protein
MLEPHVQLSEDVVDHVQTVDNQVTGSKQFGGLRRSKLYISKLICAVLGEWFAGDIRMI